MVDIMKRDQKAGDAAAEETFIRAETGREPMGTGEMITAWRN
jgi:hypothetical protein